MTHQTALELIQAALPTHPQKWGDLGAGTGLFTEVLCDHLPIGSEVYALDKSPHMLWKLPSPDRVPFHIVDADFTRSLPELPVCEGILMANALHYVEQPTEALPKILDKLSAGGTFVLIEYDIHQALPPYIPYPIPWQSWPALCRSVGLSEPQLLHAVPSRYGHDRIYSASCVKL